MQNPIQKLFNQGPSELIICGLSGCSSRGFMHQQFCEYARMPKGPPSWLLEPTSRGSHQVQCQQQWPLWAHTPGGKWSHRITCPRGQLLGRTCSSSFPRGSVPILPTSHCRLEPLGASTPTTGEQTLLATGQPQSKQEALFNIQCRLWSPHHQTQPPIKGSSARTP